jgi:CheY-like chemotaxis protein
MFYKQTDAAVEANRGRHARGKADEVRHVAHSCKGASATLGMTRLCQNARTGKAGQVGVLAGRDSSAKMPRAEYCKIQKFSVGINPPSGAPPAKIQTLNEKNPHHRRRPDRRQRLSQQARGGRLSGRSRADGENRPEGDADVQPDIIVLDLMLPKMSGVDVIKEIRSEADFSKLPIIVFPTPT